jgi:hypothetical protein
LYQQLRGGYSSSRASTAKASSINSEILAALRAYVSRDASNNGRSRNNWLASHSSDASNNKGSPTAAQQQDAINIKTSIAVRNSTTDGPRATAGLTVQSRDNIVEAQAPLTSMLPVAANAKAWMLAVANTSQHSLLYYL